MCVQAHRSWQETKLAIDLDLEMCQVFTQKTLRMSILNMCVLRYPEHIKMVQQAVNVRGHTPH